MFFTICVGLQPALSTPTTTPAPGNNDNDNIFTFNAPYIFS